MKHLLIVILMAVLVFFSGCIQEKTELNNENEVKQEMIDITEDINDIQEELEQIDQKLTQSSNS